MRIRNATTGDLALLSGLYGILDADAARLQPEHFMRGARFLDLIGRHLADPDSAIFILDDEDGTGVGFIHVQLQEPMETGVNRAQRFACVWDIAVREGFRGKGAGAMLLDAARRWGTEHGAGYMRLNVLAQNEGALRFYEKLGFTPVQHTLEAKLE